jgi:response regulator RpfG family c-di-GMP phosphodiesterase
MNSDNVAFYPETDPLTLKNSCCECQLFDFKSEQEHFGRPSFKTFTHPSELALSLLYQQAAMKVLIVEQEKTLEQSLFYFLERFNQCEVFLARSKREGLSLLQTIPFDTVLCGDRLPDGDGLDMIEEMMKVNPKMSCILMSVHHDEVSRERAMRAGVQNYLIKPFELNQLEEAMGLRSHSNHITQGGEAR